ncbi:MAG: trigger factor [Rhodobacteraceae bacterium]|nr:trigger factor [Paracoccaceae bacterium]
MIKLCDFAGEWRLTRQITHGDGSVAHFVGRAAFTPEETGLRYHETGDLILPGGQRMVGERSYLWREAGAQIAVTFADGRAFHVFDPTDPKAHHFCAPDRYDVSYAFGDWPRWQAVWRVTGPRKDYVMESHFARV